MPCVADKPRSTGDTELEGLRVRSPGVATGGVGVDRDIVAASFDSVRMRLTGGSRDVLRSPSSEPSLSLLRVTRWMLAFSEECEGTSLPTSCCDLPWGKYRIIHLIGHWYTSAVSKTAWDCCGGSSFSPCSASSELGAGTREFVRGSIVIGSGVASGRRLGSSPVLLASTSSDSEPAVGVPRCSG